jgi:hypothetical protein
VSYVETELTDQQGSTTTTTFPFACDTS